ncbi:hypothetical protein PR048_027124 [Dryococelus australis]|uniref:Uncharacterized protein n=1 Tax=Dryococelus australis TaxID=614101 RepID=A0ABQ9GEK3_9NEOP|nr:hypothetical protein PR048_027124 [Dryococelus australis]
MKPRRSSALKAKYAILNDESKEDVQCQVGEGSPVNPPLYGDVLKVLRTQNQVVTTHACETVSPWRETAAIILWLSAPQGYPHTRKSESVKTPRIDYFRRECPSNTYHHHRYPMQIFDTNSHAWKTYFTRDFRNSMAPEISLRLCCLQSRLRLHRYEIASTLNRQIKYYIYPVKPSVARFSYKFTSSYGKIAVYPARQGRFDETWGWRMPERFQALSYTEERLAALVARLSAVWWLLLATSSASHILAPSIHLSAIPAVSLIFSGRVFGYKCSSPVRATKPLEPYWPRSIPGRVTPEFRKWQSCRMMPLVGGFSSGISRFPPPLHSGAAPYSLQSSSSVVKTSLFRAAQIPSLTHFLTLIPDLLTIWIRPAEQRAWLVSECKMADQETRMLVISWGFEKFTPVFEGAGREMDQGNPLAGIRRCVGEKELGGGRGGKETVVPWDVIGLADAPLGRSTGATPCVSPSLPLAGVSWRGAGRPCLLECRLDFAPRKPTGDPEARRKERERVTEKSSGNWPVRTIGYRAPRKIPYWLGRHLTSRLPGVDWLMASRHVSGRVPLEEPKWVNEMSMEQYRNEIAGETEDPRENSRPTASSGTDPTCENEDGLILGQARIENTYVYITSAIGPHSVQHLRENGVQLSRSTVTADNQCAVGIGILVHKTSRAAGKANESRRQSSPLDDGARGWRTAMATAGLARHALNILWPRSRSLPFRHLLSDSLSSSDLDIVVRNSMQHLYFYLRIIALNSVCNVHISECGGARGGLSDQTIRFLPRRTGFNSRWDRPRDFRMWKSCPTMPLVGAFSRGSLSPPPPLNSGAVPFSPHFTIIGSQDLDIKSRPNLSALLKSVEYVLTNVTELIQGTFCK